MVLRVIGRDLIHKLVLRSVFAHASERFAVLFRRFAAPGVFHAGFGHQIPFVGTIDENPSWIYFAIVRGDGNDACAFLADTIVFAQAMPEPYFDMRLFEHFAKDLLAYVRLVIPG